MVPKDLGYRIVPDIPVACRIDIHLAFQLEESG